MGFYLQDNKIPNQLGECRLKTSENQYQTNSIYKFVVDDIQIELVIFLPKQKIIPLSSIDGKPIQRASISDVELLLNSCVPVV